MAGFITKSFLSLGAASGLAAALLTATPAMSQQSICVASYRSCEKQCMRVYGSNSWARCHYKLCGPRFDQCLADMSVTMPHTSYSWIAPKPHIPQDRGNPVPNGPAKNPTGPIVPEGRIPPVSSNGNGGIVPRDRMPAGGSAPIAHVERPSSDKR